MPRFKQIVARTSGKYAALANDGNLWEQVKPFNAPLQWRRVDADGLALPIIHVTTRGDRLVVLDRHGAVYEQSTDGRLGSPMTWRLIEMAEVA